MRTPIGLAVLVCVAVCGGCSKQPSNAELIADVKSGQDFDRIKALRWIAQRRPPEALPEVINSLKDKDAEVRWNAAIALGYYGEAAKEAIPALQAAQRDHDVRVHEGATKALSRIDPQRFPDASGQPARGK